jgi:integrase/recombinase XerD
VEHHDRSPLPSPLPRDDESGGTVSDELLTPEEARALILAASGRAPTGIRNRALVAMMYRSGLRPGEALGLLVEDFDAEAGTIEVPARKGGARRTTGVDATTRRLVAAWISRRGQRGIDPAAPLFCTLAGQPLKAAYVRELLPRLARRAGIAKRVHPLALRYANAAELAEEGMPAPMIDRHLGVAPAGAARRYRRPVSAQEVAAAVAAREWSLTV